MLNDLIVLIGCWYSSLNDDERNYKKKNIGKYIYYWHAIDVDQQVRDKQRTKADLTSIHRHIQRTFWPNKLYFTIFSLLKKKKGKSMMKKKNILFFLCINFEISFFRSFKRANPTGYPSQVSRALSYNPCITHDLSYHHYHDEHILTLMKNKKKRIVFFSINCPF